MKFKHAYEMIKNKNMLARFLISRDLHFHGSLAIHSDKENFVCIAIKIFSDISKYF